MKISRTHKPEDLSLEEWQRILRKQYGEQQKYKLDRRQLLLLPRLQHQQPWNMQAYRVHPLQIDGKKGAKKALREGYTPPYSEVYLRYGLKRDVRFKAGKDASPEVLSLVNKYFDPNGMLKEDYILHFHQFLNNISQKNGHEIRCYDDVMAHIAEYQDAEHRRNIIKSQLKGGINSPIVKNILKTKLYPYQREGALFAVNAGRCLIGDDMGLGKTIQALAAAELMAKLFNIQKVLIVSPTSLKYQWRSEIEKFTDRSVQVIEGLNHLRRQFYRNESFYKLINYELVFRDIDMIKGWAPDLIILDEAQRIKNWKTRTAQYVKQLNSTFAIVLTGTPIENRIEELHSIMEFIDRRHFGPLYRFVHNHRIVDEGGKVIGYQNLQSIRDSLKNVMMRRKKEEVLKQLPERIDKNFFVPMPKEQRAIHDENYDIVAKLVAKWRRYKFLCEADQRRLQIALNYMRMAADNTYLVDKKTIHGPKIEELEIILKEIIIEGGEKAVIFSQWLRMTELVEHVLKRNGIGYVHLNGNIPSKQRAGLMSQFMENPECKVFLSTDAGGVGLNLQSGSTVINMDIPWNPAVLEQRIGRVHRLGQQKTVRVINFVTVSSIEERMLDLLKFKKSLFAGTLDSDGENVVMIGESQLKKFMQSVETLTDNLEKVDSALERQDQRETELDEEAADIKELTLEEGGHAVSAADGDRKGLDHLNNLLNSGAQFLMNLSKVITQPDQSIEKHLDTAISRDEKTGKAYLKIPLPETEVVKTLFSTLGELISNTLQMKN